MSRSSVYISRSESAYHGASEALDALAFQVRGRSVYIKPNLTGARPSCDGLTIDTGIIRAILERLEDCPRVTIGESCSNTTEAFDELGFRQLTEEFPNVKIEDIRTSNIVWKKIPRPYHTSEMPFNSTIFQHDYVVNIAKMKTHSLAGVTLCLKNIFGFVPTRKQKLMYHPFIKKAILDMNQVIRSDFCIVDGIWGNEFDEVQSTPKHSGVIIAGEDILAVDTVAAGVMGIDVNDIVTYRLAFELWGRPQYSVMGVDPESVRCSYRQGCLLTTRIRYLKEATASIAYRTVYRH